MTAARKEYGGKFKARVAIEAIRGEKTLAQLSSQFGVHAMQTAYWRKLAVEQLPVVFADGLRGDLLNRPLSLRRLQRDLCLPVRAVLPSLPSHPSPFPRQRFYTLTPLSEFWGALQTSGRRVAEIIYLRLTVRAGSELF